MYHYHLKDLDDTKKLAEKMAQRLEKGGFLLLYGELGAGKTALTQAFGKFFNIKSKIKSPTYTLMQEYKLEDGRSLYHLDLYRLTDFDEIMAIGYEEILENPTNIVVIEWADRICSDDKPKNRLDVFLSVDAKGERNAELNIVRYNQMSEEDIQALLEQYQTPQNVRRHCEIVTHVALDLGTKLIEKGEILSLGFLYEASMLHDIVRYIDFRDMSKKNFTEKITEEKWKFWESLRKKYAGRHHAEVAQEILMTHDRPEVADIIRKHCASCILGEKKEEELITWEDKLLYYADKRVKHTQIVSLKERFRIGREQNPDVRNDLERSLEIEKRALQLEKEIFDILQVDVETYSFLD